MTHDRGFVFVPLLLPRFFPECSLTDSCSLKEDTKGLVGPLGFHLQYISASTIGLGSIYTYITSIQKSLQNIAKFEMYNLSTNVTNTVMSSKNTT